MHASDTIALTSVVAGAVVAVAGLGLGYVTSKNDREQAVWLAERNRQQARLEGAYVDLLIFAEEVGMWAQMILPMIGGDPADPTKGLPDMPSPQREAGVRARTAAFASGEVRDALEPWRQALQDVRVQVTLVQMRRETASEYAGTPHMADESTDWGTPWMELETIARPAEVVAREALQRAVAAELKALNVSRPKPRGGV